MSKDVLLIFALCSKRISTQALDWLRKFHPTASFISVNSESQGTVKVVYDEDAIYLVSNGPIRIKTLLGAFKTISVIRKSRPNEVFILHDQRNITSWIAAGLIGLLARFSGVHQIWVINHQGIAYKTSFTRLILTNVTYFISYASYTLFGRFLSVFVGKALRCVYTVFFTSLAPGTGIEISDWRMDTGWLEKCRRSVLLMNRVISNQQSGLIKPKYLDQRKCPACGNLRWEGVFVSEDGFEYARCLECGFFGASMVLTNEAFEKMRTAEPEAARESERPLAQEQLTDKAIKADKRRFSSYFKGIERMVRPRRLLDIGCATGNSLIAAQERGWQAIGIEQQVSQVDIASERGLTVLHGRLEDLWGHPDLTPGSFRAITMWETLEHVPAPENTLKLIIELLEPGGVLAVTVDSYDSIDYRLLKEKHPACCGFGGYHGHINLFNARTLELLFSRVHLNPVRISSAGGVDLELLAAYTNLAWHNIGSFAYYDRQLPESPSKLSSEKISTDLLDKLTQYPTLSPRTAILAYLWQPWVRSIGCELGIGSLIFGIAQKTKV